MNKKHNLTLANTREATWFDYYTTLTGSEEETEKQYGTRDELSEISNYFADLLDNGEKIASLEIANFDSMGAWSEFAVNDIKSDDFLRAIIELGFEENNLDIPCEYGSPDFEDAVFDSTAEEMFKGFVESVESIMNENI